MCNIKIGQKVFEFNSHYINQIIDSYIRPKFDDLEICVNESLSSSSIYVKFKKYGISKTVRLSDHPNKNMKFHYISDKTSPDQIVGIFLKAIKILNGLVIEKKFDEISTGGIGWKTCI